MIRISIPPRTWRYARQSGIPIRIPACSKNGPRSIGWASAPRATSPSPFRERVCPPAKLC